MNKKIIDLKTKFNAGVVVIMIVIACMISVMAVTRVITDENDPIDTYIICSNGNMYDVSASNLQTAITSLGETGGLVTVPANSEITLTSSINIYRNVTVDFQGSKLIANGNFNVLIPWWMSTIKNVIIDVSSASFTNSSAAILPKTQLGYGLESDNEGFRFPRWKMGENIEIWGDINTQKGMGIYIHPIASSADFAGAYFEDLKFWYLHEGIYIDVDTAGTYSNFNKFLNLFFLGCYHSIHLEESTVHEIHANIFSDIFIEADPTPVEDYQIYLQGDCDTNIFTNCYIMDWGSGDTQYYLYIADSDCDYNQFIGGNIGRYVSDDISTYIYDGGDYTEFLVEAHIKAYDGIFTSFNKNPKSNTGIKFYTGASATYHYNPITYFYGYDSGSASAKFGYLQVSSSGEFIISSDTGENIALTPSQADNSKYVRIDDVLKLDGRTTHPSSPVAGMVYYNSTSASLWLYTTAWHEIDMT